MTTETPLEMNPWRTFAVPLVTNRGQNRMARPRTTMKHAIRILVACLGFLSYPLSSHSADTPSVGTVFVYKLDGTKHCEPYAGVDVKTMALELTDSGIAVSSGRKGHDGREGIALCGAPTGQINIYEIAPSDLSAARRKGFQQLPEN